MAFEDTRSLVRTVSERLNDSLHVSERLGADPVSAIDDAGYSRRSDAGSPGNFANCGKSASLHQAKPFIDRTISEV
jgi:hypothetical protein